MAPSTRWLVVTVAVVVAVAAVAVVVATQREPADLPAGSPEAVVQRYLRAVADDDPSAVRETFAPELRRRCGDEPGVGPAFPGDRTAFDASLLEVDVDGGTARVRVRISEFTAEPPFGSGFDHTEVFVVERSDGAWGIAQAPWPFFACPR